MSSSQTSKSDKSILAVITRPELRFYLVAVFSIGVALGSGFTHGLNKTDAFSSNESVSSSDYERIQLGMSLTEAQALLGKGTEVSRSESSTSLIWINRDGSSIQAVFKEGRVVKKEQQGL